MQWRMFSIIPGLYLVNANSSYSPKARITKICPDNANVSWGPKLLIGGKCGSIGSLVRSICFESRIFFELTTIFLSP